jgi:predicted methyltransferase
MTKKDEDFGKNLRKCSNSGTEEERLQIKEADATVIEVFGVLSDAVTNAIFCRIAETGRCSREELVTLDAVVEEGESVVKELRENGLIEVGKDTVALTEKGRKVLT